MSSSRYNWRYLVHLMTYDVEQDSLCVNVYKLCKLCSIYWYGTDIILRAIKS